MEQPFLINKTSSSSSSSSSNSNSNSNLNSNSTSAIPSSSKPNQIHHHNNNPIQLTNQNRLTLHNNNHSSFSILDSSKHNNSFDLPVQPHLNHNRPQDLLLHQEDLRVDPITPPEHILNSPTKRKQSRLNNPIDQPNSIQTSPQHLHLSHQSEPTPQQLRKLTSEKRKAQNRAAQRNFRERKEKQCKKNEENLIIRTEENKKMRELVKSLEAENAFLRQHVTESVIEQVSQRFPTRRRLSSIVGPIAAYDEFLAPDKSLSESEEHTRAATALSSLASGPIDSMFDPQLQELAVSNPSIPISDSSLDLIVPDHSNRFDHHLHISDKPPTHQSSTSHSPSNLINSKLFLDDQNQLNPHLILDNVHQNNA